MRGRGAVGSRSHGREGGEEVALGDGHAAGVNQQLLIAVVYLRVVPPHRMQRRLRAQRLMNTVAYTSLLRFK